MIPGPEKHCAVIDGSALFYLFLDRPADKHGLVEPCSCINNPRRFAAFPFGEKAFGTSVEIEFTVNLATNQQPATFYLLQIRPFVSESESEQVTIDHPIDHSKSILFSSKALGNGIFNDIKDIIFVKPEEFNKMKTIDIANDIRLINKKMKARNKSYLLIGYGRWGTRDYSLGIPVKWNDSW